MRTNRIRNRLKFSFIIIYTLSGLFLALFLNIRSSSSFLLFFFTGLGMLAKELIQSVCGKIIAFIVLLIISIFTFLII